MKRCGKCGRSKPVRLFNRDKNRPDGRHPTCKRCISDYAKRYRQRPAVRQRTREYQRLHARKPEVRAANLAYQKSSAGKKTKWRSKLKRKYGLTEESFALMLKKQSRSCAVCGVRLKPGPRRHVDHSHRTGKVRGILCCDCNRALGAVKDSPKILKALISYLKEHDT